MLFTLYVEQHRSTATFVVSKKEKLRFYVSSVYFKRDVNIATVDVHASPLLIPSLRSRVHHIPQDDALAFNDSSKILKTRRDLNDNEDKQAPSNGGH